MRDAETRRRIRTATGRSLLVEAAAGTGKTTLIVGRILQGVRTGHIQLRDTVAITFTEKAAGELEERLRRELSKELHAADLSAEERARVRRAVRELDRAQISTIHAFCARLLREKPAEAGVDPEFEVMEATAAGLLQDRCWRDWMDEHVAESDPVLVEALRAGVRGSDLRGAAFALADAPEILEMEQFDLPEPEGNLGRMTAELREAAKAAAEVFDHPFPGRSNANYRGLRRLSADAARASDDVAVRRLGYEVAGLDPENALKSFKKDEREAARQPLADFVEAARGLGRHLAARVFGWARGFVGRYRQAKRKRSALDFQDLLLLSARMLREKVSVRRHFQRRFGAIFVDEFQDTDPLQAELIGYLCEDPSGPPARSLDEVSLRQGMLTVVGDPKQSIYRFRRADVEVYNRFKELFERGGLERIYCNFRSRSPLLERFNDLFAHIFRAPEDEAVYQAEHVPLEAGLAEQQAGGPGVAVLCPGPELETGDWRAPEARRAEARHVARMIELAVHGEVDLPGAGPDVDYGAFAMLFCALTDVDIYEEALEARGIPYRVVGGKHFYRRSQTTETLALLRAVDDPLNSASIVAALRSSYLGISDEQLLRYRQQGGEWNYLLEPRPEGPVGEAMQLLAGFHRRRNRVPPHVLLDEVFNATRGPEAYMLKPAGEQRAATLEQLRRRLRTVGAAAPTFSAVVRHLSSLEAEELPEEESAAVEPGDEFVQLMSMHRAKGLEFPVVILPDLGRSFPRSNRVAPLLFHRGTGSVGLQVRGGIETAAYGSLAEREHGNTLAELRRLLYVACTRAEDCLVLPLHWRGGSHCFHDVLMETDLFAEAEQVPFGETVEGIHYVDTRGWDVGNGAARARSSDGAADVDALLAARERWQEGHERRVARACEGPRFVLPSDLDSGGGAPLMPAEEGEGGGRGLGALFHEVMASLPQMSGAPSDDLLHGLALLERDRLGLTDQDVADAAELIRAAFANEDFRRLLSDAEELYREVPFSVPLSVIPVFPDGADGYVEGSMDLVATGPAEGVILDYKTDREAHPDRYWPQLALYEMAGRACGWLTGGVELALFFVRHNRIFRRRPDRELTERLRSLLVAEGD